MNRVIQAISEKAAIVYSEDEVTPGHLLRAQYAVQVLSLPTAANIFAQVLPAQGLDGNSSDAEIRARVAADGIL